MTNDRMLLFLCLVISVIALIIGSVALSRQEEHEIIELAEDSSSNGLNATTANIIKTRKLTVYSEDSSCYKKCESPSGADFGCVSDCLSKFNMKSHVKQ
tara:strand:+ start:27 stop:323 length:297 start_codon:yes stop_codon:yes gene_type:complete